MQYSVEPTAESFSLASPSPSTSSDSSPLPLMDDFMSLTTELPDLSLFASTFEASSNSILFTLPPRAEVTKGVYFDLRFKVLGEGGVVIHNYTPCASLRYESGEPVATATNIFTGVFKLNSTTGECLLRLRIRDLSKTHHHQKFCVFIEAFGEFGLASATSIPIRVLSKTSIVQNHILAAATPAPAGSRKRKAENNSITYASSIESVQRDTVPALQQLVTLRRMCEQNEEQISALNASTTAQMSALQEQVRVCSSQLTLVLEALRSFGAFSSSAVAHSTSTPVTNDVNSMLLFTPPCKMPCVDYSTASTESSMPQV